MNAISQDILLWTLLTGVISALATGLGAGVAFFVKPDSLRARAFANAFAAGMMIAASVFSLVHEGLALRAFAPAPLLQVVAGMLLGAGFFALLSRHEPGGEGGHEASPTRLLALDRRSLLLFLALFIHSIPEGVAIGVGFATEDMTFGVLMAAVIALHNVPEGIAMTLPMRAEGHSIKKAALVSVLTSLPQPVLAVPALLFFHALRPMLPVGLGFASGAMLFIVMQELLPEALRDGERQVTTWGVMLGICMMLGLGGLLG